MTHLNRLLLLAMLLLIVVACHEEMGEAPIDNNVEVNGPLQVLKKGVLTSQSGTGTRGEIQIVKDKDGKYYLSLSENFTTKFSTGTVTVYLSTSASLRLSENGSFELVGLANMPGTHFYSLSGAPDDKFSHGIIWCGAAAIPFGNALLE
jgi:hypothetical protein